MTETDLVTIKNAAKMLDCSEMTIRRRMNEGAFGPIVKRGRKFLRLYRENVEAFARSVEEIRSIVPIQPAGYVHESGSAPGRRTCDACGIVWAPTEIVTPNTCPECGEALK